MTATPGSTAFAAAEIFYPVRTSGRVAHAPVGRSRACDGMPCPASAHRRM
ncbi:hypothetical protein [Lysobacter gummosus]